MKKFSISILRFVLVVSFTVGASVCALAETAEPAAPNLEPHVHVFTLTNGLRVVLYERHIAPTFVGQTWVKAGGVNEQLGHTGLAHFLEHMAFKGTKTVGTKDYAKEEKLLEELDQVMEQPKPDEAKAKAISASLEELWNDNEYGKLYQARGGVGLNAATSKDTTYYTVGLPSNGFEFWCAMESDRLLNPVFRQFYKERNVIHEERRSRTDNDPAGKLYEALIAASFVSHPYHLPTIGWPSDILHLSRPDMIEFYKTYYRPDNMVISLVGDLNPEEVKPSLEKYFGRLPVQTTPLPEVTTEEMPQRGERRVAVEFDAQPQLMMAYHKPVYPNKDDLQFAILHSVLADGRSSILHKELVQEKKVVTAIYTTEAPGERYPSLFVVGALPRAGISYERVVSEIQGIFDRLKSKPVSQEMLLAAKRRLLMGFISSLDDNETLAELMGKSVLLYGDWKKILEMYQVMQETSASDIQRLARQYLNVSNRTISFVQNNK